MRQWNRYVRAEVGSDHAQDVTERLRGEKLSALSEWCDEVRALGMPTATMEAMLDSMAWRVGRPIPLSANAAMAREKYHRERLTHRERQRRWWWHRTHGCDPPPYDARKRRPSGLNEEAVRR